VAPPQQLVSGILQYSYVQQCTVVLVVMEHTHVVRTEGTHGGWAAMTAAAGGCRPSGPPPTCRATVSGRPARPGAKCLCLRLHREQAQLVKESAVRSFT